jgi:hypothetical protein
VGVRTCAPLRSASQTRAQLLEKYGPPEAFTPSPDGLIPGERMAAFIQVRRALQETCRRFQPLQHAMNQVDEVGKNDDATGMEIAGTAGGLMRVADGITPLIGEFFETRNKALIEAEMGFGEYIYLYAITYREALLDASNSSGIFMANGNIPSAAGTAFLAMFTRQLERFDEAEGSMMARQMLQDEIRALQADPTRVPFPQGLPPAVGASLAPYRQALDDTYCPVTTEIEMELYSGRALLDAIY